MKIIDWIKKAFNSDRTEVNPYSPPLAKIEYEEKEILDQLRERLKELLNKRENIESNLIASKRLVESIEEKSDNASQIEVIVYKGEVDDNQIRIWSAMQYKESEFKEWIKSLKTKKYEFTPIKLIGIFSSYEWIKLKYPSKKKLALDQRLKEKCENLEILQKKIQSDSRLIEEEIEQLIEDIKKFKFA